MAGPDPATTLTTVSETRNLTAVLRQQPLGRRGPWFAAVWLFFLLDPLLVGWHHRGTVGGVSGMLLTLAFGATYMWLWIRLRADRARLQDDPGATTAMLWLGVLVVL